jgi:hypothetical protein
MKIILTSFFFLYSSIVYAQNERRVYLGEGMDRLFDSAQVMISISGEAYPLISFAGYTTRYHQQTNQEADTAINRPGFILGVKKTETAHTSGNAVFGNEQDSSLINYQTTTEQIYHGRSFLMSVSNLAGANQPQHPYDELRRRWEVGTIRNGNTVSRFYHDIEYTDYPKLQGWLVTGTDTLTLVPAPREQVIKNGKIKSRWRFLMRGMQLMQGDVCVAAFDRHYFPNTIYIARQLPEKEKQLIAAYFFVLAANICAACQ